MELGTGIPLAALVLAGAGLIWKLLDGKKKNNPNSKYLLTERFEEYKEGVIAQLLALNKSVDEIKTGVKRVHGRVDEVLKDR